MNLTSWNVTMHPPIVDDEGAGGIFPVGVLVLVPVLGLLLITLVIGKISFIASLDPEPHRARQGRV